MRHPWPLYLKLHPAPSLTHALHLFSLCLLPRNVVFYIVCLPLWCHTYGCGGHAFLSLYSRAQRPCALHTRCKLRKVMAFYLFCGLRPCCISRALNHAVCVWLCVLVTQACLALCDPMNYSLPGSSVHGIFHARILEWVVISSSRWFSQPRDQTQVSCLAGRFFTTEPRLPRWYQWQKICLQMQRCQRPGFNPWVRKIPWGRKWLPTPVFLLRKFHGQRSLVG